MSQNKKICVVGASGLVGSSIVRLALEKGYFVNGTLRDKSDISKVKCLTKLKNSHNLDLFDANKSTTKFTFFLSWITVRRNFHTIRFFTSLTDNIYHTFC